MRKPKGPIGGLSVMEALEACRDRQVYSGIIHSEAAVVCREVKVVLDRLGTYSRLGEDDHFDVKVILNELLQNAIRHGNAMNASKTVSLDVSLEDSQTLEISVEDEGPGFDVERTLAQKRRRCFDVEDLCEMDECGRGLLIIETLCDTVQRNATGNRITVRKQLHPVS